MSAKLFYACCLMLVILSTGFSLAQTNQPEIVNLYVCTLEGDCIDGDSITILFNKTMLINTAPYPQAGGMEDINNVPGSEKKAPAEYPLNRGNATAKKAAKNYHIRITPGARSKAKFYQGTWADLGGEAYYLQDDPLKTMVVLKLNSKTKNIFEPGDQIELTISNTVEGPKGNRVNPQKAKKKQTAS